METIRFITVKTIGKWQIQLRLEKRDWLKTAWVDITSYIYCEHNDTLIKFDTMNTHVGTRKIPKSIFLAMAKLQTLERTLYTYTELTRGIQGLYDKKVTSLQYAYNYMLGKLELEYSKSLVHLQYIIYNMITCKQGGIK